MKQIKSDLAKKLDTLTNKQRTQRGYRQATPRKTKQDKCTINAFNLDNEILIANDKKTSGRAFMIETSDPRACNMKVELINGEIKEFKVLTIKTNIDLFGNNIEPPICASALYPLLFKRIIESEAEKTFIYV